MTQPEFQLQVARLIDTYGKAPYPDERIRILWRDLGNFGAEWLRHTIDDFIASQRHAPMPSDFGEACSRERERLWRLEKAENEQAAKDYQTGRSNNVVSLSSWKCALCSDQGVYLARSKLQPGFFAFRCHCPKGNADPRKGIPHYKVEHEREFYWIDDPRKQDA